MILWTAFSIGLVGSLHCIGMCGPIALALPYQQGSRLHALGRVLLYNTGRVLTYTALGTVIGLAGRGLFLAGVQSWMSIALGALFLIAALFSINLESRVVRLPGVHQLNTWVQSSLGRLLRRQDSASLLGIGALNGLLPCGLVYMAVAGAVTSGSAAQGAAFMALFGLGTVPMMAAVAMAGQFISLRWRNRVRKLLPVFLITFAFFFIARGLNFTVPADIRFWETMQDQPMCH
jgi:sulfite exporter TauE/SafE